MARFPARAAESKALAQSIITALTGNAECEQGRKIFRPLAQLRNKGLFSRGLILLSCS